MDKNIIYRLRRNRKKQAIRDLCEENILTVKDLIMPLFVKKGHNIKEEIPSMPNIYRLSEDMLLRECEELMKIGIRAIAPFPIIEEKHKDRLAQESYNSQGMYQKIIRSIKNNFSELLVITDVAMDPYSSDGHDGIVNQSGEIENDSTLDILAKMALTQAESGADIVAPSDMMDSRVGFIRNVLDENNFHNVGILAYSVKYASHFYGPFREALNSAPKKGDKKTYQMNPANMREALREIELDINEGADIIMIKPGLPYLDIIRLARDNFDIPIAAYNVSGEYAMLKAAGINNWLDYKNVVLESLLSFKRAGCDMILTYHAKEVGQWIANS